MAVATSGATLKGVEGNGSTPRHPIYRKLSSLNKEVSSLTLAEVKIRLEQLGLSKM